MQYRGFTLDPFQEDAIEAIDDNASVVVSAPTGSGKTLIADYIINKYLEKGIRVVYTAPIKALSNQKYKEFSTEFGEENIGLMTGDVVRNPTAPILIMTTEIYRNMVISGDEMINQVSYVIFDEIHYINDIERGVVWEESIIFSAPHVRMLCLSATIPNAEEFASWIHTIKGHEVRVIKHEKRPVPLHLKFFDAELGLCKLDDIKEVADIPDDRYVRGRSKRRRPYVAPPDHVQLIRLIKDKLPCLFFNFSRASCQQKALDLSRKRLFQPDPKITSYLSKKFREAVVDINRLESTRILRQTLPVGIGFHHAGLLPFIKEIVEELFSKGLIKVLYTTETFAVGINMPAKSVAFEALRKFDGISFRLLNAKEFFQTAGRAGRRGIDKEGFVFPMIRRMDFEYSKIRKITTKDTEPIISQFRLTINTVLNLIRSHDAEEIDLILKKSFHSFQRYGEQVLSQEQLPIHRTYRKLHKKLEKLGFIENNRLTPKGEFSARIYADEIEIGELFATDFYTQLTEYQMLMLIGMFCYEAREKTRFKNIYPSAELSDMRRMLTRIEMFRRDNRLKELKRISSMLLPCYEGKPIFQIFDNTNLLEGDVIRFLRQVVDRMGQIRQATRDRQLQERMESLQERVLRCIHDVDPL
ncbi:MAG: DEAD/DEAH box helicase [archaeon]